MGEPEGGGTRSGRTFPHHWIEEERETSSILEDAHPRHAHLGEERGGILLMGLPADLWVYPHLKLKGLVTSPHIPVEQADWRGLVRSSAIWAI